MNKIFTFSQIEELKKQVGQKKVVLVGGCFDLFHYGHLKFLQGARREGEVVVVALESDDFIMNRKKRQPVHTQQQRAEILASLTLVDYILQLPFLQSDEEYSAFITILSPAVIGVTEGDPYLPIKQKHAKAVGGEVKEVCAHLRSYSTSGIISYASLFGD